MTDTRTPVPIIEKAKRAIDLARLILGANASLQDVEDTGVSLMYLPLAELEKIRERLKPQVRAARRHVRRKR